MDSYELLLFAAKTLDQLKVRYLITGSMATMTYGEARFTNDVDIVADLQLEHVDPICKVFAAPEYYCSVAAVKDAITRRFQFNVIQPATGLKIDFMIPTDDPFNESRLARGRLVALDDKGNSATFASAEDAILKKLEYYREGGSDKHLRDVRGVLAVQGNTIDLKYLRRWAKHLNVTRQLEQMLDQ